MVSVKAPPVGQVGIEPVANIETEMIIKSGDYSRRSSLSKRQALLLYPEVFQLPNFAPYTLHLAPYTL